MTPGELVLALEKIWDKSLKPDQRAAYLQSLRRFSESQLEAILPRLVETCKYMPRPAHAMEAAAELGFLSSKSDTSEQVRAKIDTWEPTGCPDCKGGGLVRVMLEMVLVGKCGWQPQSVHVNPLYDRPPPYRAGLHEHIRRCHCSAGTRETLPEPLSLYPVLEEELRKQAAEPELEKLPF